MQICNDGILLSFYYSLNLCFVSIITCTIAVKLNPIINILLGSSFQFLVLLLKYSFY